MSLETIKKQMEEANAQITKLREELNEKGKQAFGLACKELFAIHPNLKAFRWRQYTPYFNDGNECTFGVNDVYCQLHEPLSSEEVDSISSLYDEDDEGDQWLNSYGEPKHPSQVIIKDACEVRDMLDEDSLKEIFGDHVEITVTADGVETDEYSHD